VTDKLEGVKHPVMTLSSLSRAVSAVERRPIAVGIDGPGGSGKSTLARELSGLLPLRTWIVQGDDFYGDIPNEEKSSFGPKEGYEKYFDWQRLKSEVLTRVREGAIVLQYQQYNWETETLDVWIESPMPDVVIVEGVYVLRPELRNAFDVTVLLNTSRPTRIKRQVSRGENTRLWIDRWMAAEDFYFAAMGPWEWVDFTLEGE
jgi:uridine kinase